VETNFFGTLHVCQVMISWQTIYFKYSSCLPGNDQLTDYLLQVLFMSARKWSADRLSTSSTLHVCQVMISWQTIYFKYSSCLPGNDQLSICFSSFFSCPIGFNANLDPVFQVIADTDPVPHPDTRFWWTKL
jgi:uncharacterized protein (DUF486 family)